MKASNTGAGDWFGASVAVSGDTVVVGAPYEDSGVVGNQADNSAPSAGAAYVFVRNGTGWSQQAYLKASNTGAGDHFGWSVAMSGDTVVIGANGADSAYVFVRSGATWTQQAHWSSGLGGEFGFTVAVSGDTVVVGAPFRDPFPGFTPGAGDAYVYARSGTSWSFQASLNGLPSPYRTFGYSVAVSGDTVVVGRPYRGGGAGGPGGAQVFVRSGTNWVLQSGFSASNGGADDYFGSSVAVSGDTVVAGATGSSYDSAYVFVRSGTTWTQQAQLNAANPSASDEFGCSVAVSGDTVVVGAYQEDSNATGVNGNQADNSATGAGAAYVFVRSGTTWTQHAYLKASNTGANDSFGYSVAVSGDTVVIGALGEESAALASGSGVTGSQFDNSAADAGAIYVFDLRSGCVGSIPAVAQQAYLKASNTGAGDGFGSSVAASGDTVVIGAYGEDSNATGVNGNQADNSAIDAGAAYVFVRSGGTWTQQAYLKASNTGAGDQFGWSVAVSGDTVVIGALGESSNATGVNGNQADNSATSAGAAYVFVRNGTTWSQQAYLKASNTGATDVFGWSVAVSGDTVVISSLQEDSNATGVNGNQADNSTGNAGAAYVFVRSFVTWTQQAYLKASNTGASDQFGCSVAVSGDTAVVGAFSEDSSATGVNGNQADNSTVFAGAAYVFARNGTTWSQQAYLKASNTGANDLFGWSVAVSGDTVVVGAYSEDSNATGINGNQANNGATNAGAAYVFVRSGTNWSQQAYLKASNTGALDQFGESVAVSGDTVIVGADGEDSNATGVNGNQADNSATDAGAAYVFDRYGTEWKQRTYLKASNTASIDAFGYTVAVSGDTVVVGAYQEDSNATGINGNQADNSATDAGAAYTFSIARQRPSLWPLNAPQIGQNYTLAIDNLDPTFNVAILMFGATQFPLPGIDLGFLGIPGGDLYQTLDISISAPPGSGGSTQWTWSPVAGSPGDTFYCQALCLDPAANAFGFTLSNQVTIKLVP